MVNVQLKPRNFHLFATYSSLQPVYRMAGNSHPASLDEGDFLDKGYTYLTESFYLDGCLPTKWKASHSQESCKVNGRKW